ncbi:uncharacterized protein LOC117290684 [Asterias rubens]|uniref:uncharacterized protein LOC117290684 n=1 Tax=Asterias rubens TaxID=7604 RepID=UPI0014555AC2|nr:uncharacterized protein LOC117290684 [Asterias rubens]
MAERVTAKSVLRKISQRHLECQICIDRFVEPKMLECSHSYCLKCLQQLAQTNPTSQTLICPVCRSETLLVEKGVFELRNDFKSTLMLDEIEQHETELRNQQENQPPNQEYVSKCSKHTDKDVIMYCDSCKQLICTTCIAKDHSMHPATELSVVFDNCMKKTNEIFAEVGQHYISFKIAMQDIELFHKTLDSMFAATKAKISKKADDEIAKEVARIREEENKLMLELVQTFKDKSTKGETAKATNDKEMTKAQNMKVVVTQLMDKANFSENLLLIENMLQDLKEYTKTQPKQVAQEQAYIDFEDDQESFGRLRINAKQKPEGAASAEARMPICKPKTQLTQKLWTLKAEIITYRPKSSKKQQTFCALSVASYCNSDIVCDIKSNTLITISADSIGKSKVISKELSIKGLTDPIRVAVNKNDKLIVVDDTAVKIFNRKYKRLHQFALLVGQPFDLPPSIAVDDNNLIAVGYHQIQIDLHRQDGSFFRTLLAPGIGQYLSIHKQHLIYIKTRAKKKLVSIDYDGNVVFSVDINQSWWYRGLCCDKDGSIYVAVWDGESSSGDIHHYSPDGEYIGCIIKGCTYPHGITFTPAGDLVVATQESVQIYCHD